MGIGRPYLAGICGLAFSTLAAAALAETPTMVSAFRTATVTGIGSIVSAVKVGSGPRTMFVYEVTYGTKHAKRVKLCSGSDLRVGAPVLFAIGKQPQEHASCPKDAWLVPESHSMSTYVLEGFVDAYTGRLVFRFTYPLTVLPGCKMPLTTVHATLTQDGKRIDEFGPLVETLGSYFFAEDFLRCVSK
jgi:hypothetical protein